MASRCRIASFAFRSEKHGSKARAKVIERSEAKWRGGITKPMDRDRPQERERERDVVIYRLYHAVEVYTRMYKTAETGLETRARSARVSKVSKVLCIPVYTDTAWYKVFMPCRCTARARTRAMALAA